VSGGGLVIDLVTPLAAEAIVFSGSNLASIRDLVTDFTVGFFKGTDGFFTEDAVLAFSEALLASDALEDPDSIVFAGAFRGDPGDLGDPGDKVFDPVPVLEVVRGPDFFTAVGKVMMFCNKNIQYKLIRLNFNI